MLFSIAAIANTIPPHLAHARTHVGVRESGGANRGKLIDGWNREARVPLGSSWCGSFVGHNLTWGKARMPVYRGGLARRYASEANEYRIPATRVASFGVEVPIGSIAVWHRGGEDSWSGHVGITNTVFTAKGGRIIEGNTSSGEGGSQWNGDGVYNRWRTLDIFGSFRMAYFVIVRYQ